MHSRKWTKLYLIIKNVMKFHYYLLLSKKNLRVQQEAFLFCLFSRLLVEFSPRHATMRNAAITKTTFICKITIRNKWRKYHSTPKFNFVSKNNVNQKFTICFCSSWHWTFKISRVNFVSFLIFSCFFFLLPLIKCKFNSCPKQNLIFCDFLVI